MLKYYIGITILSILVGLVIIGGIIQTGGPFSAKNIKLDEERLNNFKEISSEIRSIYLTSGRLPANLQEVVENKQSSKKLKVKDPETNLVYEYNLISSNSYNLCTIFSTDSREISEKYEDYYFYESYANKMKNHKKGRDCIAYSVTSSSSNDSNYNDEYYDDEYDVDDYDVINDSRLYEPTPTKITPNVKATMITPNYKWHSDAHSADITISEAYIAVTDLEGIQIDEKDKKLFIVFDVSNRGTQKIIYPKQLATLVAERDTDGALVYSILYQGYNGPATSANKIYGSLVTPEFMTTNVYELSVGDPGKEQTVNLDFTNAKEVEGKFNIHTGFTPQT